MNSSTSSSSHSGGGGNRTAEDQIAYLSLHVRKPETLRHVAEKVLVIFVYLVDPCCIAFALLRLGHLSWLAHSRTLQELPGSKIVSMMPIQNFRFCRWLWFAALAVGVVHRVGATHTDHLHPRTEQGFRWLRLSVSQYCASSTACGRVGAFRNINSESFGERQE